MRIKFFQSRYRALVPLLLFALFCSTPPTPAQEADDDSQTIRIERNTPADKGAGPEAGSPSDVSQTEKPSSERNSQENGFSHPDNVTPAQGASAAAPEIRVPVLNGQVDDTGNSESLTGSAGGATPDSANTPEFEETARNAAFRLAAKVDHANVVLLLDTSGSQSWTISTGAMQAMIDRLCPAIMGLTGDAQVDTWAYADRVRELPPITRKNLPTYVSANVYKASKMPLSQFFYPRTWLTPMLGQPEFLGLGNKERTVMQAVIDKYKNADYPTIVILVTDGGVDERAVTRMLSTSSSTPIFWKFVGFHSFLRAINDPRPIYQNEGQPPITYAQRVIKVPSLGFQDLLTPTFQPNYYLLQNCEMHAKRTVDNSDFVVFDDFAFLTDPQIEDRLMAKIPGWVALSKQVGIIRPTRPVSTSFHGGN